MLHEGTVLAGVLILSSLTLGIPFAAAQEQPAGQPPAEAPLPEVTVEDAALTAEINDEGGRIVLEAKGVRSKIPLLFRADAREKVEVTPGQVDYEIALALEAVQGRASSMSLALGGSGELQDVTGEGLKSWGVRRVGEDRFLDLQVAGGTERRRFDLVLRGQLAGLDIPASPDLLHLRAGEAVGFTSTVEVRIPVEISSRLVAADGFLPLASGDDQVKRYEGALGKRLAFAFSRSSAVSAPVELANSWLEGTVDEDGGYVSFVLRANAAVSEDNAAVEILRGQAAASEIPAGQGYRMELAVDGAQRPVYHLRFPKAGSFPVEL